MFENTYYPQETLRKALTTSFVWMALGLLVTAATSYLCYSTGWYLWMLTSMRMIGLLLFIVQIGLVFAFQSAMQRSTATGIKVLFMVYAVTFGISLTSLFYTNSQAQLTAAFLISAVYFICLAFIGLTTKKNLNSIGMSYLHWAYPIGFALFYAVIVLIMPAIITKATIYLLQKKSIVERLREIE